jgi:cell division protein FtsB
MITQAMHYLIVIFMLYHIFQLKEKTQEVRKLRADVANAKLQLTKVNAERDALKKSVDSLPTIEEEKETIQKELIALKQKYFKVVEDVETKDSELEAKTREAEVLKETVDQLKNLARGSLGSATEGGDGEEKEGGGDWDDFEDPGESHLLLMYNVAFRARAINLSK